MADKAKTEQEIRNFLEAYKKLKGEEKLYFISEIEKATSGKGIAEKRLFLGMVKAAHAGLSVEDTIAMLQKG
jgi:hypothetical protein